MQGGYHFFSSRDGVATIFGISLANQHQYLCKEILTTDQTIAIFCAKSLQNTTWNSPELKQLVGNARRSYERYGDVPLYDEYDERAAVYLAITTYQKNVAGLQVRFVEVASIRFVPGYGDRPVIEDFELFHIAGKSLLEFLKEAPHCNRAILDNVVSISRLSATEPVPIGNNVYNTLRVGLVPPLKRRSIASAFILMNHHFFSNEGVRFEYISGVMRRELMISLARGSRVEELWSRSFPLADDFLMCGPCDVALNHSSEVVYRFPGYFLNREQIRQLLLELLETDRLTYRTLEAVLKVPIEKLSLVHDFEVILSRLGRLFSYKGDLPYAGITGEYLRQLVRMRIADGPRLYLGYCEVWRSLLKTSYSTVSRQQRTLKNIPTTFHSSEQFYASSFG